MFQKRFKSFLVLLVLFTISAFLFVGCASYVENAKRAGYVNKTAFELLQRNVANAYLDKKISQEQYKEFEDLARKVKAAQDYLVKTIELAEKNLAKEIDIDKAVEYVTALVNDSVSLAMTFGVDVPLPLVEATKP